MRHPVSIIGLGVMGQRMLGSMHRYAGFDVVVCWDPDEAACRATQARFPGVRIAASADEAVNTTATTVVYIACPPVHHAAHASAAFDAGKAVWCEKPLGVDVAASEALVDTATRSGQVNIVNFSLASAVATAEIEQYISQGTLGDIVGIDLRVHFSKWPREWQQAAASWLSYRTEGGFTREVVSHWVYLSERLFGRATLDNSFARFPDQRRAETHLHALLEVGGQPLSIACSAGGTGPDLVEYTIRGSQSACRVVDWNRLFTSDGGDWQAQREDVSDPREAGYERQLSNAANAVAGQSHSMPSFADALSVQRLIEAMLR